MATKKNIFYDTEIVGPLTVKTRVGKSGFADASGNLIVEGEIQNAGLADIALNASYAKNWIDSFTPSSSNYPSDISCNSLNIMGNTITKSANNLIIKNSTSDGFIYFQTNNGSSNCFIDQQGFVVPYAINSLNDSFFQKNVSIIKSCNIVENLSVGGTLTVPNISSAGTLTTNNLAVTGEITGNVAFTGRVDCSNLNSVSSAFNYCSINQLVLSGSEPIGTVKNRTIFNVNYAEVGYDSNGELLQTRMAYIDLTPGSWSITASFTIHAYGNTRIDIRHFRWGLSNDPLRLLAGSLLPQKEVFGNNIILFSVDNGHTGWTSGAYFDKTVSLNARPWRDTLNCTYTVATDSRIHLLYGLYYTNVAVNNTTREQLFFIYDLTFYATKIA